MEYLYDKLIQYGRSDYYPMHMPGHKRRLGTMEDPFSYDITEIEGFDNLHHGEGVLLEAEKRAAKLYGSQETHFLINGSTAGILSAIGACAPSGKILMARNSHKAAYHAVFLNHLEAVYLYPEGTAQVNGPINPEAVEKALQENLDIKAVFITSPTYDGVISNVDRIAKITHEYGIPLIVDEAHGAHFGMHPIFPESSVKQGADVVIHSLHKTLPSLTQTALIHVNGSLADRRRLRKLLGIYQSSSPSYVLMSSMDQCVRMLEQQGKELFQRFAENLEYFWEEVSRLEILRAVKTDDPSKILIFRGGSSLTGLEISNILRETYHIELEMAAGSYALALTSVGDDRTGFWRLAQALKALDEALLQKRITISGRQDGNVQPRCSEQCLKNEVCMSIWEAENHAQRRVRLEECAGCISGEYIYLYPPGIPLAVPGERIGTLLMEQFLEYRKKGYSLQGLEDYSMKEIWII